VLTFIELRKIELPTVRILDHVVEAITKPAIFGGILDIEATTVELQNPTSAVYPMSNPKVGFVSLGWP
jgi:hypothetical protein